MSRKQNTLPDIFLENLFKILTLTMHNLGEKFRRDNCCHYNLTHRCKIRFAINPFSFSQSSSISVEKLYLVLMSWLLRQDNILRNHFQLFLQLFWIVWCGICNTILVDFCGLNECQEHSPIIFGYLWYPRRWWLKIVLFQISCPRRRRFVYFGLISQDVF